MHSHQHDHVHNQDHDTCTVALGNSFGLVLQRSFMVFIFWFLIVYLACVMYNEVVISRNLSRYTCPELELDGDDPDMVPPELEEFRLDNQQMVSAALTIGTISVAVRLLLEAVRYMAGAKHCAVLSGIPADESQHESGNDEKAVASQGTYDYEERPAAYDEYGYDMASPPPAANPVSAHPPPPDRMLQYQSLSVPQQQYYSEEPREAMRSQRRVRFA